MSSASPVSAKKGIVGAGCDRREDVTKRGTLSRSQSSRTKAIFGMNTSSTCVVVVVAVADDGPLRLLSAANNGPKGRVLVILHRSMSRPGYLAVPEVW
jgi:hypothetical protein